MSEIPNSGPQSKFCNVGKISLDDLGCSTNGGAPLPLKYPANLIFAQNMLAMSVCQTQQLEMHIAMLSLHLRERMLASQTVPVVSQANALSNHPPPAPTPAAIGSANRFSHFYAPPQQEAVVQEQASPFPQAGVAPAEQVPVVEQVQDYVAHEYLAADAAVGADPGAPAAAGAANAEQPAGEQVGAVWQQYRLAAIMKIALIMILLEVKTGWFFVYFFAVFLYIGGVFDPFVEWFQRHTQRLTLDQQLTRLRNKRRMRVEKQAAAELAAALAQANPEGSEGSDDGGIGIGGDAGNSSDATQDDSVGGDGAQEGDQAVPEPAIPWGHRFFYQLVVMFFMTLLPWWSPDPRYIE